MRMTEPQPYEAAVHAMLAPSRTLIVGILARVSARQQAVAWALRVLATAAGANAAASPRSAYAGRGGR
jgi:hypothetical protein